MEFLPVDERTLLSAQRHHVAKLEDDPLKTLHLMQAEKVHHAHKFDPLFIQSYITSELRMGELGASRSCAVALHHVACREGDPMSVLQTCNVSDLECKESVAYFGRLSEVARI